MILELVHFKVSDKKRALRNVGRKTLYALCEENRNGHQHSNNESHSLKVGSQLGFAYKNERKFLFLILFISLNINVMNICAGTLALLTFKF